MNSPKSVSTPKVLISNGQKALKITNLSINTKIENKWIDLCQQNINQIQQLKKYEQLMKGFLDETLLKKNELMSYYSKICSGNIESLSKKNLLTPNKNESRIR